MPGKHRHSAGYTLLELLYVIGIISLLGAMLIPQILTQKGKLVEAQAQRRLKTVGSVMADYALADNDGSYPDFYQLKHNDMIAQDVTMSSLIVDYSLSFINPSRSDRPHGTPPMYTIIAYPIAKAGYAELSTFAITEDNVVRVYRPGPGVSVNDPHTWDPIL